MTLMVGGFILLERENREVGRKIIERNNFKAYKYAIFRERILGS